MRNIVKLMIEMFFTIVISPIILCTKFNSNFFKGDSFFITFGKMLSLIPGFVGVYIRRAFYSHTLMSCGKAITVEFGAFFSRRNACLGNNVYIGAYSILGTVTIGDDVLIASRVSIPSGRHQHMPSQEIYQTKENVYEAISVGFKTWIGEGAIILANVGSNSIVGAGSVVVKNVADGVVVAGNPASEIVKKKIK